MSLQLLRKIGLSDGEIKVYSTILELGQTPVNDIHEKTGMDRRNIYDILNKLVERGLVSYEDENKRRTFQAVHPKRIIGYIEEKKNELDIIKNDMVSEIPKLVIKFELAKPKTRSQTFRGLDGIKAVWEDILNYNSIWMIGSGRYIPKQHPGFFNNWNRRRIKLGIKWQNLMRHEMRKEINPYKLEYVKYLPKEFSGNPAVIWIFGDKVAQMLFGQEYFGFVIESKELSENYRKYFKYLWNKVAKD